MKSGKGLKTCQKIVPYIPLYSLKGTLRPLYSLNSLKREALANQCGEGESSKKTSLCCFLL